jgi:Flp pilus assembly protein TadB
LDWLFVAALGILWVAFLLPRDRRRHSPERSVEGFEHDMEVLADTETPQGRWIVVPKKGTPFLGSRRRKMARTRERRRRVFVFLLESIGITFLIGAVPPLREVWMLTILLVGLLVAYVFLLISLRNVETPRPKSTSEAVDEVAAAPPGREAARFRYVAEGRSRSPRPAYNGLGSLGESDRVHVVVRSARELNVARA